MPISSRLPARAGAASASSRSSRASTSLSGPALHVVPAGASRRCRASRSRTRVRCSYSRRKLTSSLAVTPRASTSSSTGAEVCRRDLHAGAHGSDGTQLRVEARPVQRVGLVEQLHRADVVPGRGADLRGGHEPSVPVLGDRAVLTGAPSRSRDVLLPLPDRCARGPARRAPRAGRPWPAGTARRPGSRSPGPARTAPRARCGRPAVSHMSPSTTVLSSSSTRLPAECRLRTAAGKVVKASSTSPPAQAARPRIPPPAPRTKWSSAPARSTACRAWATVAGTSPRACANAAR